MIKGEDFKQKMFRLTKPDIQRLLALKKELCIGSENSTIKFIIKMVYDLKVKNGRPNL